MNDFYKFLSVPDHEQISQSVYDYVINHTSILQQPIFWNWLDTDSVLTHVPLLSNWLKQRRLTPVAMAIIYVLEDRETLHADTDFKYLRILWPVANCAGSVTKFWNIDRQQYRRVDLTDDVWYYPFAHSSEHEQIGQFELTAPVIFDTSIPHSVHPNETFTQARLSLTIGFDPRLPASKTLKFW